MKKCIIFLIALMASTATYAQFFTVGPKVGFSSSRLSLDEARQVRSGQSTVGFHAGAFTRFSVVGIYLQPELLFTQAGGEIEIQDQATDNFNQVQELTYNKLDVPVMLGFRMGSVLRVNAGPSFSLILGQDARTEGTTAEVKNRYEDATVGYQIGGGLMLASWYLTYATKVASASSATPYSSEGGALIPTIATISLALVWALSCCKVAVAVAANVAR